MTTRSLLVAQRIKVLRGNGRTYQSNGYTMNSAGYLANPSRSAQIKARNAGALTNSEARSMGLRNYRDEMDDDEFVGRRWTTSLLVAKLKTKANSSISYSK